MTTAPATIRVVIPLTVKRRNGRPRIVPPDDLAEAADEVTPDPRMLRAIARAWDWRRRLERGEVTTLGDIAQAEKVTVPYVSRVIRLAYLSPEVLEHLLIHRRACAVSIDELAATALKPWVEQGDAALDQDEVA